MEPWFVVHMRDPIWMSFRLLFFCAKGFGRTQASICFNNIYNCLFPPVGFNGHLSLPGSIPFFLQGTFSKMAVGQNQWYHFGVGEFTTHFSLFEWDWDVHWDELEFDPWPRGKGTQASEPVSLGRYTPVANLGDLAQRWTNDLFRSSWHRAPRRSFFSFVWRVVFFWLGSWWLPFAF